MKKKKKEYYEKKYRRRKKLRLGKKKERKMKRVLTFVEGHLQRAPAMDLSGSASCHQLQLSSLEE